jgi:uncharacterized protein (TIGR00375 family)
MNPEGLWRWAQLKGIKVVGTGDFTHPEYIRELRGKLEPVNSGGSTLFSLKPAYAEGDVPDSCSSEVLFMLTAEISSIYSKGGKTRKVHSVVLAPGIEEAEEINARLSKIGNLKSDGRPILGLDAKALLEIVIDVSSEAMVIPAHAWTPHFSVFGAVSGFDSLEECYEDLTSHIYAIETGLSSDPPMNRRLSALDNITLISNSDAHSPSKLGREANIFDTDVSYERMIEAIKTREGFEGTIEFFPEEGKYHYDGHRNCGVCLHPEETLEHNYMCPVCKRKLTVGVMHRVEMLADRKKPKKEHFKSIIPFAELIAESMGRGVNTKGVQKSYFDLLSELGNEFSILMDVPVEDIRKVGGDNLGEAITKMRGGKVNISPGFDGEYGKINIFGMEENVKPVKKKTAQKKTSGTRQTKLF